MRTLEVGHFWCEGYGVKSVEVRVFRFQDLGCRV